MNEHSRQMLAQATRLLEEYRAGQTSFRSLVYGLDASLSSLEERLPDDFYTRWHAHWDELEAVFAEAEYQGRQREIVEELKHVILKHVEGLEDLLSEYVKPQSS